MGDVCPLCMSLSPLMNMFITICHVYHSVLMHWEPDLRVWHLEELLCRNYLTRLETPHSGQAEKRTACVFYSLVKVSLGTSRLMTLAWRCTPRPPTDIVKAIASRASPETAQRAHTRPLAFPAARCASTEHSGGHQRVFAPSSTIDKTPSGGSCHWFWW